MSKISKIEKDTRTTLLFLSWRDIKAPKSGGAEVFTHEMLKRMDMNKYRIIHISPMFKDGLEDEIIDGVRYIREGSSLSVIPFARKYYKKNKKNIDYVVDQCNTHRFFTKFWVEGKKRIFFIHQLTREIWHLNAKFPVSTIGALTETMFLRLSRKDNTITVSQSTKNDLIDVGFNEKKVYILPEGLSFKPWQEHKFKDKEKDFTYIYVGRFVNYKGIDAAVESFGEIKKENKTAKLWIVGKKNEAYIQEKLAPLFAKYGLTFGDKNSGADVIIWGFVSEEEKYELMSRANLLLFPSLREGWGLIVTEAAAVGTPSLVYNSPGIVDAVDFGKAGFMTEKNTPEELAVIMKKILKDNKMYAKMSKDAYEFSKLFHWDNTAAEFDRVMDKIQESRKK